MWMGVYRLHWLSAFVPEIDWWRPHYNGALFFHTRVGPEPTMFRTLLKSKIHRVALTHCELHYEGSCAIDEVLQDAANICENEQIHIWNINNDERFVTYAIKGQRGSGMISVNGSVARRASNGDLIIIAAFAQRHEDQVAGHSPKLVFVNGQNQQTELRHNVPTQLLS
jgi:L-aspartate-alpha-decarboxylase